MNSKIRQFPRVATLLAIAVITVIVYVPGMSAGLAFDDEANIIEIGAIHWQEFSPDALRRTLEEALLPSRPLANVSFAITHLFSGLNPAPYHWTNLVIHLVVGLALFWVLRALQKRHTPQRDNAWIAALAVLVFLVHPLNIQSVTYVVQRMTSMAALFVLLGFGSYLTARYHANTKTRVKWLALTTLCFGLALASKEIGLLLLPLIVLYEICFNGSEWLSRFSKVTAGLPPFAVRTGSALLIGLVIAATWVVFGDKVYWSETMPSRDFSGYERLLTQGRVLFFYVSLLLWPAPSRLNLDHDFAVSRSLFDPVSTLVAALGWLLVLAFAISRARSRPTLAFPILAYLLLHSIEAAPINLELVFEHRMYLPMTMLALLMALNLGPLNRRFAVVGIVASAAIVLSLATATYQRNMVWGDELAFARDCAIKSPGKWRPQYNLGTKLGERGMIAEAKEALENAVSLRPRDSHTNNQLGNVYMILKQPAIAEKHYRMAIESYPQNAEALYNLAMILAQQRRYAEQREILKQFVEHAPPYLERQKQQAIILLRR